jgi:transposase-like protein
MPLTPTSLYCPNWDCQQLKTRKSYTLKGGAVRQLYRCPECQHCFSETHDTPLANLKTPLSQIVLILQALNEGLGECGLPSVPREQKQPLSLARTFE